MKTSKKLLALLLTVAMVIGLVCVVSASFPDVEMGDDYASAISLLQGLGIVEGDENGKFKPASNITRAEFAKMLCVSLTGDEDADLFNGQSIFADVEETAWYNRYVNWANAHGLMQGYGDGTFGPNDELTLAQIVKVMVIVRIGDGGYSYPYGYMQVAYSNHLLDGIVDDISSATVKVQRAVVAQLFAETLNSSCDFLDNEAPLSLFDVRTTASQDVKVLLIGSARDTNNGAGLTEVDAANKYCFATIEQGKERVEDGAFDHILTVEYDGVVDIPVGAPVILTYEVKKDEDGNVISDAWYDTEKIIGVEKGYTSAETYTADKFTLTSVNNYEKITYKLNGVDFVPEKDWHLWENFVVKTFDGSLRAGHAHYFYFGNSTYDYYYDAANGTYGWDYITHASSNCTKVSGQVNWYEKAYKPGGVYDRTLDNGLVELGRCLTKDTMTVYDTNGDGVFDYVYYNPLFSLMGITKVYNDDGVDLTDCAGNAEYVPAGAHLSGDQISSPFKYFKGDYVNMTVTTDLEGVPQYTFSLCNQVTGTFTGGTYGSNGQVSNVTVGGKAYGFAYCNIEHGNPSYTALYTRFGKAAGNAGVNIANVGKDYTLVIAPNGGIGRVVEYSEEDDYEVEFNDRGLLNLAQVEKIEAKELGTWVVTTEYTITLKDIDGVRHTYNLAKDVYTLVDTCYEQFDRLTDDGNLWFDKNSNYYNIRIDNSLEEPKPFIEGAWVNYELDREDNVIRLIALEDMLQFKEYPTNAEENKLTYRIYTDIIAWNPVTKYVTGETCGLKRITKADELLVFLVNEDGEYELVDMNDLKAFEKTHATFITMADANNTGFESTVERIVFAVIDSSSASVLEKQTVYGFVTNVKLVANEDYSSDRIVLDFVDLDGVESELSTAEYPASSMLRTRFAELNSQLENFGELMAFVYLDKDGNLVLNEMGSYAGFAMVNMLNSDWSYGVLVGENGEYIDAALVVDKTADGISYGNPFAMKLAEDVKIYTYNSDRPFELSSVWTARGNNVEMLKDGLAAGTVEDLNGSLTDGHKMFLYTVAKMEDGVVYADRIIVVDEACLNEEYTISVIAESDAPSEMGPSFDIWTTGPELTVMISTLGGTPIEEKQVLYFTMQDTIILSDAPMAIGENTCHGTVGYGAKETEYTATYTVSEQGIGGINEYTVEITKMPDKTEYMLGEEIDLAGLELSYSLNGGSLEVAKANQWQLVTTELTATSTCLVVKCMGVEVEVPITITLPYVDLFLVGTSAANIRTMYNGTDTVTTKTYAPDGTLLASTAGNGSVVIKSGATGEFDKQKLLITRPLPTDSVTTAYDFVVYPYEGDVLALDSLVGTTVRLYFGDSEMASVVEVVPVGDHVVLSIDDMIAGKVDATHYNIGGKTYTIKSGLAQGKQWYMENSQNFVSYDFVKNVLPSISDFPNSGNFRLTDMDGDGEFDLLFFESIFKIHSPVAVSGNRISFSAATATNPKTPAKANNNVYNWMKDVNGYPYKGITGAHLQGKEVVVSSGTAVDTYFKIRLGTASTSAAGSAYYYIMDANAHSTISSVGISTTKLNKFAVAGTTLTAADLPTLYAVMGDGSQKALDITTYIQPAQLTLTKGQASITVSGTYEGINFSFTLTDLTVIGAPTSISIFKAPDKTSYKNGDLLDFTGMIVKATTADGTFTVPASEYTVDKTNADYDDQKFTVSFGGKTADQALTVEENSFVALIAGSYTNNLRRGSEKVSMVNGTGKVGMIPLDGETVITFNNAVEYVDATTSNSLNGLKGAVGTVTINKNGAISNFVPLASVVTDGTKLVYDSGSNTFTNDGVAINIDVAAVNTNSSKHSAVYEFIGIGTGELKNQLGRNDEIITLYDTDGDSDYDFYTYQTVFNGAKVVELSTSGGYNTVKVTSTMGSRGSTGWITADAGTTATFVYRNPNSVALAVGDYINFTVAYDASITITSGNSNFHTAIQVIDKAASFYGKATDVQKSADLLDITFKVNGADKQWSNSVSNYAYADGTQADNYANAGRGAFTEGDIYKCICDKAGNVVRVIAKTSTTGLGTADIVYNGEITEGVSVTASDFTVNSLSGITYTWADGSQEGVTLYLANGDYTADDLTFQIADDEGDYHPLADGHVTSAVDEECGFMMKVSFAGLVFTNDEVLGSN